ncbi:MAG: hypothetical protein VB118_02085 [Oscillospiraceae bacterium]|nr:hypothetical protein [Oscillospiraceae bacterium]
MNELVANIRRQTEIMLINADIMLKTCNLDFILCDIPIWKHVYHMLYSCDQWFISPFEYDKEPDFHEPNLNSLDIPSEKVLSRETLASYLETLRDKTLAYIDTLTDDRLYEIPKGCASNRLGLIVINTTTNK